MLDTNQVNQLASLKMASQPTPAQIIEVQDFTQLSEKQALILLRKNHGDPTRAVEAYYNDPSGSLQEDVVGQHLAMIHHSSSRSHSLQPNGTILWIMYLVSNKLFIATHKTDVDLSFPNRSR